MTSPTAPVSPQNWKARLVAFGELRDAVLFGATALYVLGYSTWAIYSADRGLGILPPLEGQYFLAGALPFLILGLGFWILRAMQPSPDPHIRRKTATLSEVVTWIAVGAFAVGAQFGDRLPPILANAVSVTAVVGIYLGMLLKVRSGEKGTGWMRWLFLVAIPLLAIAAGLGYATRLFPHLPAEFGGPQPLCVTLDVSALGVSRQTAAALGVAPKDTLGAIRTGPLWQHFEGGGVVVVSRQRGRPVQAPIRLRETSVLASVPTTSCDTAVTAGP